MCEQLWAYTMPYLLGYAVAIVGGQIVIGLTINILWSKLGTPRKKRHGAWHSMILGTTEIILYVAALKTGNAQFIAVWLGLKTVIKWRHWESDIAIPHENGAPTWVLGRNAYNLFLLGNALVLLFAAVGWKLIYFASIPAWPKAIAILLALLFGSIGLVITAYMSPEYPPLKDSDPRVVKTTRKG